MVLKVGSSVLARLYEKEGWYAGVITGVEKEEYKIVFIDGVTVKNIKLENIRSWDRPKEQEWHRRNKIITNKFTKRRPEGHALNRGVEQLDPETREVLSRWPNPRRAQEAFPWISNTMDIILCCRGHFKQAGGYAWRFVESRTKLDTHDVAELLAQNARIQIQKNNPKRKPSKSHDLYEKYKYATTVREMINLGGRRADIAYDITHGWITFEDPELNRRFSRTYTGAATTSDTTTAAHHAASEDDNDDAASS